MASHTYWTILACVHVYMRANIPQATRQDQKKVQKGEHPIDCSFECIYKKDHIKETPKIILGSNQPTI